MGKKKVKRSRSSSATRESAVTTTPPVILGSEPVYDTPSDSASDVKSRGSVLPPANAAPTKTSVATTLSPPPVPVQTPAPVQGPVAGGVIARPVGAPAVITMRFIAENGRAYPLSQIPPTGDFKGGVVRARCTGIDTKEKTSRQSGKPFIVLEVLLTDTVTRMLKGTFASNDHLPKNLPAVGDFVLVRGVQVEPAVYDALLYGDAQLSFTRDTTLQVIKVGPSDPRVPAGWSPVSVRSTRAEPTVTVDDFFSGL